MADLTKDQWRKSKTVVTPQFRVSFPHVFKPHAFDDKQKAKYSIVMLFDKTHNISALKQAADAAAVEKWGADKTKWPKNLRSPFRDGNEKSDLAGYAGTIFVSASTERKPGLINRDKVAIELEEDFYGGCYARAEIVAFAYDNMGNKGVSFALNNIQKIKDGDAFSGRKAAEVVFDDDFEFDDSGLEVEDGDGLGF